ncbi:MAG: hypothetical protein HQK53_08935 [Oligoflexia bacterium]|nr:hypothetical protein [Oligoflexia bacterium]
MKEIIIAMCCLVFLSLDYCRGVDPISISVGVAVTIGTGVFTWYAQKKIVEAIRQRENTKTFNTFVFANYRNIRLTNDTKVSFGLMDISGDYAGDDCSPDKKDFYRHKYSCLKNKKEILSYFCKSSQEMINVESIRKNGGQVPRKLGAIYVMEENRLDKSMSSRKSVHGCYHFIFDAVMLCAKAGGDTVVKVMGTFTSSRECVIHPQMYNLIETLNKYNLNLTNIIQNKDGNVAKVQQEVESNNRRAEEDEKRRRSDELEEITLTHQVKAIIEELDAGKAVPVDKNVCTVLDLNSESIATDMAECQRLAGSIGKKGVPLIDPFTKEILCKVRGNSCGTMTEDPQWYETATTSGGAWRAYPQEHPYYGGCTVPGRPWGYGRLESCLGSEVGKIVYPMIIAVGCRLQKGDPNSRCEKFQRPLLKIINASNGFQQIICGPPNKQPLSGEFGAEGFSIGNKSELVKYACHRNDAKVDIDMRDEDYFDAGGGYIRGKCRNPGCCEIVRSGREVSCNYVICPNIQMHFEQMCASVGRKLFGKYGNNYYCGEIFNGPNDNQWEWQGMNQSNKLLHTSGDPQVLSDDMIESFYVAGSFTRKYRPLPEKIPPCCLLNPHGDGRNMTCSASACPKQAHKLRVGMPIVEFAVGKVINKLRMSKSNNRDGHDAVANNKLQQDKKRLPFPAKIKEGRAVGEPVENLFDKD